MKRIFLVILGITAFLVAGAIAQTADTRRRRPTPARSESLSSILTMRRSRALRRRFSVPMLTLAKASRTCW